MSVNFLHPRLGDVQTVPGFECRGQVIGLEAGSERLGASLYEVAPGHANCPYHWHAANEEMLIVLSEGLTLRDADGWRDLAEGEVVSFRRGERGVHQVANRGNAPARFLVVSEMRYPEIPVYPDSGKVGVRTHPPASPGDKIRLNFLTRDAVDYWEGEAPPAPEGD